MSEGYPRLYKIESVTLHYIVAKLLWAEKRGRPDIEPEILVICTRATQITVEEKVKLKRVLKFLKQKINYKIVMEAEKLSQLCTLDDATYGVHPYLNIYTGGGMPFD